MTMGIYIPSCKRTSNIGLGVARFASPAMLHRMVYVVPSDETEAYRAALQSAKLPCAVISCPEAGIAKTRLWIGEYAQRSGEDKFAMIDDDCWFYTRTSCSPTEAKLEYSVPDQIDEMMKAVEIALDTFAHAAVSAREGNNRLDERHEVAGHGSVTAAINTRTLRFLAYQTAAFLSCEHGRVEVQEDFDVNLQLLEKGLPNINLAHWAQGQRQTNAPGGCSGYRTHAVQDASARRLAELHPGLVRLRQKNNKSGGEFGQRTEVTIMWKSAYEQGRAALLRKQNESQKNG